MTTRHIGVIGMAVMGQNLALNMQSKGFPTVVYNRTAERTKEFMQQRGEAAGLAAAYTIEEFMRLLERPRRILFMVKAGEAVDDFIRQIRPHMEKGDLLIDGGNSHFKDTERRNLDLEKDGFLYIGTGISGGEEGALKGPSIMPGGQKEAYDLVADVLCKIAAQTEDGPCCAYMGPRGAGHYVKMVHNGIEYGIMQLIAEAYDMLSTGLGLKTQEIGEIVAEWNDAELGSYLMEITRDCLVRKDDLGRGMLVDKILDTAGQKGTGKWASQDALDVGYPIPTIDAAVHARILSAYKTERVAAAKRLRGPGLKYRGSRAKFIQNVRDGLYCSVITSYAQGMGLLTAASKEYNYNLNLAEIARIWKGGCIIRSKLLDPIKKAYAAEAELKNLMLAPFFRQALHRRQANWRECVSTATKLGIPCLAFCTSLAYYDSYRRARLPANLIQAQRDYFGAHTYQRIDREGVFHTEWLKRD